ncbi:Inner membrane protein, partial [Salmonella enterica subsp. enterica serovar Rubislaw str. A4-653]
RKNKSGSDSVPLLGDIPWLGQLFRHDGKEDERRELVVFITPRLVRQNNLCIIKKALFLH